MIDENRYDILQEVGRGATGIVYKAIDRETTECVALKVLKREVLDDNFMMDRFKNELRIARRITHKNVCRIYEFTHIREGPCISMEYVEGETIRSLLTRIGVFGLRSALEIASQICSGLREAHAQGIVHRDLKPENLMIDRKGNVKIMDFGVARVFAGSTMSTLGLLVGTPAYMAPEQVEGGDVDQRADIYSLGLILYEMFTGSVAFKADTPVGVAYKQVHEVATPPRSIDPNISENLQNVILRCIEKEPERRFQTIEQLQSALSNLDSGSPTSSDTRLRRMLRPHATTFIMPRNVARPLMLAVQVLYFSIYAAVLFYADSVGRVLQNDFDVAATVGLPVVLVLTMCGIAARIYLTSALIFDHPDLPRKFRRLFPVLWMFDGIWAASPLLLINKVRFGLILGAVALLAYVPFSQRTLMENMSRENPR